MSDAQKKFILGSLVVLAWLLHTFFCEWHGGGKQIFRFQALTLYVDGVSVVTATVVGILLPLALIAFAVYLRLGWASLHIASIWFLRGTDERSDHDNPDAYDDKTRDARPKAHDGLVITIVIVVVFVAMIVSAEGC